MQCGWITYDLDFATEAEARRLIETLYQNKPEATIYLDRGRGWEFVNPQRAAGLSLGAPPGFNRTFGAVIRKGNR